MVFLDIMFHMPETVPNEQELKVRRLKELLVGEKWSLPPETWQGEEVAEEIEKRLLGLGWTEDRIGLFPLAVDEAFKNAVIHGTFKVKVEGDNEETRNEAREKITRENEARGLFKDKAITIELELTTDEATVKVTDQGSGFLIDALPDPTDPSRLLEPTGRGISYMKNFCDQVSFEGSTIILYKKKNR